MKREILVINQIKEFLKTEGTMEITEQKILHSAKKLFLTLGYHKTTMIALANQAEVNKALIHYYFSDKETLYKTCKPFMIEYFDILTSKYKIYPDKKCLDIAINESYTIEFIKKIIGKLNTKL
jgi:hypothetical protein